MEAVVKEILAVDRNSALVRAVDNKLSKKILDEAAANEGKRQYSVNQFLEADQQDALAYNYPEYKLNFKQTNKHNHGYAAASRALELEVLLSRAAVGREPIIDVGGNYATHILTNRPHIHSCAPILDERDAARNTERMTRLKRAAITWRPRGPVDSMQVFHNELSRSAVCNKVFCHRRAQDCAYQADYAISVHSCYDIDFNDMARIMFMHGTKVLYGCFNFFPAILTDDEGTNGASGAHFRKIGDDIEFTFRDDPANGYSHKYERYLEYVTRTGAVYNGIVYYYELMENRGGVQFFKFVLAGPATAIARPRFKNVWTGMKELYIVRVFEYGATNRLALRDARHELRSRTVTVPAALYQRALEYALGLDDAKADLKTIFSYLRSINNRLVISGVNVSTPERVDVEILYPLASSVYAHALAMRYSQNQVTARLQMNHDAELFAKKQSTLQLAWRWLLYTSAGSDGASKRTVRDWLLKKLDFERYKIAVDDAPIYIRFDDFAQQQIRHRFPRLFGVVPLDDGGEADRILRDHAKAAAEAARQEKLEKQLDEIDEGFDRERERRLATDTSTVRPQHVPLGVSGSAYERHHGVPTGVRFAETLAKFFLKRARRFDEGEDDASSPEAEAAPQPKPASPALPAAVAATVDQLCQRMDRFFGGAVFRRRRSSSASRVDGSEAVTDLPPYATELESGTDISQITVDEALEFAPVLELMPEPESASADDQDVSAAAEPEGLANAAFDEQVDPLAEGEGPNGEEDTADVDLDETPPPPVRDFSATVVEDLAVAADFLYASFTRFVCLGVDETVVAGHLERGHTVAGTVAGCHVTLPVPLDWDLLAARYADARVMLETYNVTDFEPIISFLEGTTATAFLTNTTHVVGAGVMERLNLLGNVRILRVATTSFVLFTRRDGQVDLPRGLQGVRTPDDDTDDDERGSAHPRAAVGAARVGELEAYLTGELNATLDRARTYWHMTYSTGVLLPAGCRVYNEAHELGYLSRAGEATRYRAVTDRALFPNYTPSGDYSHAWDGDKLVPLRRERDDDGMEWYYAVGSACQHLLIWRELRLVQCQAKLDRVPYTDYFFRGTPITLVEGVPGCGKTTEIITRASAGDLILTVARKTAGEIRARIAAAGKDVDVRTTDSYFLNLRTTYNTVWLDEGLMIHAGEVEMIAFLTQCQNLYVYGDRNQLNFISRVAGFSCEYAVFDGFDAYEFRALSYRVPHDVANAFGDVYAAGFRTTNTVRRSMEYRPIYRRADVPIVPDVKYITFTQDEKRELQRQGAADVNTVHECQGMTFKRVFLVRTNTKQLELYSSRPHILVALTRHTQQLLYYSMAKADDVVGRINSPRGMYNTEADNPDCSRNTLKQRIDNEPQLDTTPHAVEVRPVGIDRGAYGPSTRPDIVSSAVMTYTAYSHETVVLPEEVYEPVRAPQDSIALAVPASRDLINAMQLYYDSVLPLGSTEYAEYDEYQIETSDLNIFVSNCVVDLSNFGTEPQRKLEPPATATSWVSRLRTAQPNDRKPSSAQTLLALMKRNCDTPANATPLDVTVEVPKIFESFERAFLMPSVEQRVREYRRTPVELTTDLVEAWVRAQEPNKLKRVDVSKLGFDDDDVTRYQLMTKREAKNKLEVGGALEYLPVQNIVYHWPELNVVFGAVFKTLYERFVALLRPNVCVMLKKSRSDLERHMNVWMDPARRYDTVEVDFSKYDKSQVDVAIQVEMLVYEMLGLDATLLDLWKKGHFQTTATDFVSRIKAHIVFQRKSGTVTTCFGNTLVAMLSLARTIKLDHLAAAYFVGDDSLLFSTAAVDTKNTVHDLSQIFNLTAKVLRMRVGYFCSMFVLQTGDKFTLVPDPLKRIERLSKPVDAVRETSLRERFESFAELVKPLADYSMYEHLMIGLDERYGRSVYAEQAVLALLRAGSDYRTFMSLYQRPCAAVFKNYTSSGNSSSSDQSNRECLALL